jgi:hypothetical protein
MKDLQLAQINVARLLHPEGDPRVQAFFDNLAAINSLADRMLGFVWRLKDETGDATGMAFTEDRLVVANLSVWESVGALERFVFKTVHRGAYVRRRDWFAPYPGPHFAMWWIKPGTRPDLAQGARKLEQLARSGPTAIDAEDGVFGWNETAAAQAWRAMRCAS